MAFFLVLLSQSEVHAGQICPPAGDKASKTVTNIKLKSVGALF